MLDDILSRIEEKLARRTATTNFEVAEIAYGDSAWDESKHPRAPDGKFASGAGGGGAASLKPDPAQFKGNKPKQEYTAEKLKQIDAALASEQPYKELKKVSVKVATNKELADYLHAVAMENHPSVAKGIGAESLALRPDPQDFKHDYKKKEVAEKLSLIDDALEAADPYAALSEIELKASTQSELYAYQQSLLKELHPAKKLGVPQDVINTMPDPASWDYKYQQQIAKAKIAEINAALTKPDPIDALSEIKIDGKAYASIEAYKQGLIDNMGAALIAEPEKPQEIETPETPSPSAAVPEAPSKAPASDEPTPVEAESGDVPASEAKAPSKGVAESSLTKIGKQLGSNPGYQAEDGQGNKKYVKLSKSDDHAKNEVCAAKLYELAGAGVVKYDLLERNDGKLGTVTDWDSSLKSIDLNNAEALAAERQNFAVHAWLANWDAIGLDYDNAAMTPDGKAVTMDVGGAMLYRAQGEAKTGWGPEAQEWTSMRTASVNKEAASVYGGMTAEELENSAKKLEAISDEDIKALVAANGPGDDAAKAKLAETLIARRDDILAKAGLANEAVVEPISEAPEPTPEPTPVVQSPKDIDYPVAKNGTQAYFNDLVKDMWPGEEQNTAQILQQYAEDTSVTAEDQEHAKKLAVQLTLKQGLPKPVNAYQETFKSFFESKNVSVDTKISQFEAFAQGKFGVTPEDQEYAKKILALLPGDHAEIKKGSATSTLKVSPAPVAKPKLSDATKQELETIKSHFDKISDALKPAVIEKHDQIAEAVKYAEETGNLDKIKAVDPIPNPAGMGQKSTNAYLEKVKQDLGAAATKPSAPSPAVENAVKHVIATKGHFDYDQTSTLYDAKGQKVKARLKVSSESVPGGFYEKATAAFGNSPDKGLTPAVDQAYQEYHNYLKKNFPPTVEQNDALTSYKTSGYSAINKALLHGGGSTETLQKIKHITESMHPLPADTPAFRGVRCNLKTLTGFDDPQESIGRIFEHPNFASISRDEDVSRSFAGTSNSGSCLMKFTVPAGTKGFITYDQTSFEREIILHPKSMWRIDRIDNESKSGGKSMHVIHVTYLGERLDA